MQKRTGVILGKFMPPHMGHCYLVDFGRAFVDELWIFVCSLPHEPIPGTLRHAWMKELFPYSNVVHIEEVNPKANRAQVGAQTIWANAVLSRMNKKVDYVFASEEYGWDFAAALGAHFIPVDPSRDQFPISGSELRDKPFRNWHFLPRTVRTWFVKTICITEAEPSLIPRLASHFQTLYVPAYEPFFNKFAHNRNLESLHAVLAENAQFEALKSQARCFLFVDTKWANANPDKVDFVLSLDKVPQDTALHYARDCILDHFKDFY